MSVRVNQHLESRNGGKKPDLRTLLQDIRFRPGRSCAWRSGYRDPVGNQIDNRIWTDMTLLDNARFTCTSPFV
jgi:hypothetical protein